MSRRDPATAYSEETVLIVPPVTVAVIDGLLAELSKGSSIVSKYRMIDMLLDVRRSVWTPNDLSLAVTPVMQKNALAKVRKLTEAERAAL